MLVYVEEGVNGTTPILQVLKLSHTVNSTVSALQEFTKILDDDH